MRGDSVRDLYAKTLALLGLGLLAGTGALVDYWPVGVSTPAVATPFSRAPLPGPLAVDEAGVLPDDIEPAVAVTRPRQPATPVTASATVRVAPVPALPARLVAASATLPRAATVRLREPAIAPDAVAALASHAFAQPEALPQLAMAGDLEPPAGMPRARLVPGGPSSPGLADEGDGPITGAFKKAGSSIVKTGAKTGASIFDTFRVVSGMVRRALPSN